MPDLSVSSVPAIPTPSVGGVGSARGVSLPVPLGAFADLLTQLQGGGQEPTPAAPVELIAEPQPMPAVSGSAIQTPPSQTLESIISPVSSRFDEPVALADPVGDTLAEPDEDDASEQGASATDAAATAAASAAADQVVPSPLPPAAPSATLPDQPAAVTSSRGDRLATVASGPIISAPTEGAEAVRSGSAQLDASARRRVDESVSSATNASTGARTGSPTGLPTDTATDVQPREAPPADARRSADRREQTAAAASADTPPDRLTRDIVPVLAGATDSGLRDRHDRSEDATSPDAPADTRPQNGATTTDPAGTLAAAHGGDRPAPAAPIDKGITSSTAPASQIAERLSPVLLRSDISALGTTRLTIRLDPVELGHVEIRVEQDRNLPTRVQIMVERPETLSLLIGDQPALERALDRAGVAVDARDIVLELAPPETITAYAATGSAGSDPRPDSQSRGGSTFPPASDQPSDHGGQRSFDSDPRGNPRGGQARGSDPGWDGDPARRSPSPLTIVPDHADWRRLGLNITA